MVFNCFEVGIWKLEVYEKCLLEILCNNKLNVYKSWYIQVFVDLYTTKIYVSQFPTTTTVKLSKNFCTIWWYNHSITYFKNSFYKQIINILMIQKNPHDSHTKLTLQTWMSDIYESHHDHTFYKVDVKILAASKKIKCKCYSWSPSPS